MKPTSSSIYRFACAVLFTAAVATARADYPSTVLSHNPVGYWRFDDAVTSPAQYVLANSGTVGSVANAYAIPTVTNGVGGKIGNAIKLYNPTGTGHVETKADVAWNTQLNTPNFSVEFWVQPSSTTLSGLFDGTGSCPLSNFNPNNFPGGRVGWLFYLTPAGVWNFRLGLTSGYATTFNSPALASAGVWQHVAATYDGLVARLYVNGVQVASANSVAANTGWVPNTGSFLRFGGTPLNGDNQPVTDDASYAPPFNQNANESTSGNRGFDGLLDEVALYTNVLSAATIKAHYDAATTNTAGYGAQILAANPSGYWNFDEPAVTRPSAPFPVAVNSGTLLSAADGTNVWGALANQAGAGYAGFGGGANKAVDMDGMMGYTAIKDAPGLHFTGQISLAAWVKVRARDYNRDIISHGWNGGAAETFLRITKGDLYGSGYYYEVGTCDGEAFNYYDSAQATIPDGDLGNWVFVVGTFDGSNWNLYRNGVLAATAAPTGGDTGAVDVTNYWTIGARSPQSTKAASGANVANFYNGYTFAGGIDEPAIFTNALSASDILALYNAAQVPPVITRAPSISPIVFKGTTASLNVWAEGSGTLGYMWISNGVPTGVTTTNYSIPNIQNGSYTISVVVTNAYGTNSPSVSFTVIPAPPSIVTAPKSAARFVGYPFNLSVVAGGSQPMSYYWYFGNTLVGTSSSYGHAATLADAGSYKVVLSNETGVSVTSAPVTLTVYPVLTGYSSNVLQSGPIAYWRLGEAPASPTAFDAVAGNDGVYNNPTLGVAGYSLIDSNTAASFSGINSYVGNVSGTAINFPGHSEFSLEAWVNAPSGQSDEATIIAKGIGNTGTTRTEQFSVDVAAGNYRFFFVRNGNIVECDATVGPNGTWQHIVAVYDGQNLLGGGTNMYIYVNGQLSGQLANVNGPNTTTSVLSIGSKRLGNQPDYEGTFNGTIDEVAVYNTALSAATVQAHYAAAYGSNLKPFINLPPQNTTNYAGLPATLSVSAAGTVPLTYQWKKNNVDIPGATDSSISFTPLVSGDQASYSVGITNSVGSTNSANVFLAVLPPPSSPPNISGLVLHMPFDGNLLDTTGRGNNGTGKHSTTNVASGGGTTNNVNPDPSNGGLFEYTAGELGQGLHFTTQAVTNGSGSVGTNAYYVSLGVRPDLKFNSNSFSVAYWIRTPLGYLGGDLPFFCDAVGSEGNNGFVFAPAYGYGTASPNPNPAPQNYGGWALTVYGGGAGVRLYGDLGSINDGNWHHLVHVTDRAAGSIATYLDGAVAHYQKIAGTTVNSAGNIDTTNPAMIGQDPTGIYGEDAAFDIDDLGVWRKALTPLEAASIYAAASFSGLSFTNTATSLPNLTIAPAGGNKYVVTWSLGTLQTATNATGPYTSQPFTSPYTNTATTKLFYRTRL